MADKKDKKGEYKAPVTRAKVGEQKKAQDKIHNSGSTLYSNAE